MAFLGTRSEKVAVNDNVLFFNKQEKKFTTSFDGNCTDFEFWMDRNFYVGIRETFLALKVAIICDYEAYNVNEVKKGNEDDTK